MIQKTVQDEGLEYFNVEVSYGKIQLVINASKRGITTFIESYGNLSVPPEVIFLNSLCRPKRNFISWEVHKNKDALPTDPTPYMAYSAVNFNIKLKELHIQHIQSSESILAAGIRKGNPFLIVSSNGWQKFLTMLKVLRDQYFWFYVTIPNNESWTT